MLAGDVDATRLNYTKITWTDDYDYAIKDQLDAADDVIVNDQLRAVEMFEKIMENYPQSARAKYSIARALDIFIYNSTDIERETLCGHFVKARAALVSILDQGHEKELMRRSASHLLQRMAEDWRCYSRPDQIRALTVMAEKNPTERYSVVLAQELFLNGDYDEALATIETVLEQKKHEFGLNVIKSTILRLQDKEKEARAFLREIDLDDALEASELNADQVGHTNYLISTRSNFLDQEYEVSHYQRHQLFVPKVGG